MEFLGSLPKRRVVRLYHRENILMLKLGVPLWSRRGKRNIRNDAHILVEDKVDQGRAYR